MKGYLMHLQAEVKPGKIRVIFIILCALVLLSTHHAQAGYTIGLFNNGAFCTSTFASAYQTGSFSITETTINNSNGFTRGQTGKTLILGFSGGSFQFNPGIGTVTVSGTGVTIVSYSITATNITVTITTASTNTQVNTISFNNIQVRATAVGTGKIVRTGGNFLIDNRTTRPRNTTTWGALTTSTPITYASATTTQTQVSFVFSGASNNLILGMQVVVTGTCSTLAITQFNFNTTGSTNAATDIVNAKVYYTGTTNSFSTTTLFGSQAIASGAYAITGSVNLAAAGTYYFWLTYDVAPLGTSINGDLLDGQFASVIAGGVSKTPTISNPTGSRTISNNIYYSIAPGNWNNTTTVWSKSSGGPTCSCTPNLGNGWVFVNHAISLTASSTVDIVTIQNNGVLTNTAGSVLTTNISLNTSGTGIFTISANAWGLNDVTLSGSGISGSTVTQTLNGDLNIGATATLKMTAASGTTLTVNDDIDIDGILSLSGNNFTASTATGTLFTGTGSITGTGTITLGVSKLITATSILTIAPVLSISAAATVTNQGTVTMTNNISGTGTWVNDVNANLNMAGTTSSVSLTNLIATSTGNTISYAGSGAQTIKGTTYENITAGGSGTKTLGGATVVDNAMTLTGSAQLATAALALSVDNQWINNSSNAVPFLSTGTVTFTGTSSITGSSVTTFNNLNISASGDLLSHPAVGMIIVQGNWVNDGDFDNNNADITFSGTTTISGASITVFADVIVAATKSLTLPSGGEIDLEGDLTVNGTLSPSTSLVSFSGGGAAQNIIGSTASLSFYQLTVDNISGSVQLQRPAIITNGLNLTNGLINTSSVNTLTLNNGVTISGGSSTSFVNGPLVEVSTGNNTVKTFPIGKGSDYRPVILTITASGNPTSNYTAELFNASTTTLGYALPVGIDRASGAHYWIVTQSTATGFLSAKAQLQYDVNDQVSDPTHLVVLKNSATNWTNLGGTGSAAPTGTITSNAFTTFGTFTLGNSGSNSLPVELVKFQAVVMGDRVELHWTTASELNSDYFTVEKTKDVSIFEAVAKVPGAGTSTTSHVYGASDMHPYSGTSFYRLKQTDYNGAVNYSEVVTVDFFDAVDFSIYPNPATQPEISIRVSGVVSDQIQVTIGDLQGNQLYSAIFLHKQEPEVITIGNVDRFGPGIYIIHTSTGRQSNYQRLIIP